jgi:hypothetical protein
MAIDAIANSSFGFVLLTISCSSRSAVFCPETISSRAKEEEE